MGVECICGRLQAYASSAAASSLCLLCDRPTEALLLKSTAALKSHVAASKCGLVEKFVGPNRFRSMSERVKDARNPNKLRSDNQFMGIWQMKR